MVLNVAELLGLPLWLLAIVLIWSLVWKGLALWKSARKSHSIWFVILLVINTLGILEILYIFLFSEIKMDEIENKSNSNKTAKRPTRKRSKKR